MWLYLPSGISRCSAAAEDSTLLSDSQLQTLAASAAWRTMPRSPAFWRLAWKKGALNLLRSGLTLEPSTADAGVATWMESLGDSRVPICPWPENKQASTESTQGYGGSSPESYAKFNPDGSMSKTSLQCSLFQQDEPYSENFTPAGTMRSGSLFERPMWEPVTRESGFSFWPTADANTSTYSNGKFGENLREASVSWPTPRSEDAESAGNHPEATDSLTGATRLWASPQARDHRSGETIQEYGNARPLSEQVLWNTPTTSDSTHPGGDGPKSEARRNAGEMLTSDTRLRNQIQAWSTPSSHDGRRPGSDDTSTQGRNLKREAESSPLVPAIPDGPPSLSDTPSSRPRLSPPFVCWLMGLPWWWTHPEPISFAPLEMRSWRFRAARHLSNLFGGPEATHD